MLIVLHCSSKERKKELLKHLNQIELKQSETVKSITLAAFSNISLETFMVNLVSLSPPSLPILGKSQTGVLQIFGFLVNPL